MLQKSKAEELRVHLLVKIESMQPGERLMSIRQIMREFEISQSTVDQALSRLEVDGKIERKPGKGIFVRDNNIKQVLRISLLVPDWPSQSFIELEEMLKIIGEGVQITRVSYQAGSDISDNLPVKNYDAIIFIPETNQFSPEFLYKISSPRIIERSSVININ